MKKRVQMTKRQNKKKFRKGLAVDIRNKRPVVMRGGYRI